MLAVFVLLAASSGSLPSGIPLEMRLTVIFNKVGLGAGRCMAYRQVLIVHAPVHTWTPASKKNGL